MGGGGELLGGGLGGLVLEVGFGLAEEENGAGEEGEFVLGGVEGGLESWVDGGGSCCVMGFGRDSARGVDGNEVAVGGDGLEDFEDLRRIFVFDGSEDELSFLVRVLLLPGCDEGLG